jgi:uncharacterized membrane protein
MENIRKNLYIIIFLAICGILDSSYLTYVELNQSTEISCFDNSNSCSSIQKEDYSKVYGIPISTLGIIYYFTILIFSIFYLINLKNKGYKNLLKFLFFYSLIGILISSILIYILFFVISGFCIYCILSCINCFLISYLLFRLCKFKIF